MSSSVECSDSRVRCPAVIALGLLGGLGAGVLGARVPRQVSDPPKSAGFQAALVDRKGQVAAAFLMARVRARYRALESEAPHFGNRALARHLTNNILPGLALYHVFCEETGNHDEAMAEVDAVFERCLDRRRLALMRASRWTPDPMTAFRAFMRTSMPRSFPRQGWQMEQVADDPSLYAFNMHTCFYWDVLAAYGAADLTRSFCRTDDLLLAHLPPPIVFRRQSTLARGAPYCDFRFERRA